jgi:hypothetical protein
LLDGQLGGGAIALPLAAGAAALVFVVLAHQRYQNAQWGRALDPLPILFPSPSGDALSRTVAND